MKKCFIYCRQSSGSSDSDNSLSIQQQLTNCLDTARKLDLEVSGVFTDANVSGKTYPAGKRFEETAAADKGFQTWFEQQSGSKKFRNGLGCMMDRLQEVEFIVVDEITRLHRAASNSFLEQVLTYEITSSNVKIIQVKGGTLDLKSFDQNLIHILKTRINDEQIANQKRKSIESRKKLRDSGIFCNVKFYGAVYDGNKKFHFDPPQAEVIIYVFKHFIAGDLPSRIVYDINQKFADRVGNARCFYPSTLKHILTQPLYAGLMYDSEGSLIRCSNAPTPLVTEEQFFKAAEIIAQRQCHICKPHRYTARPPLIFSGFLRCGYCGSNLLAVYDRNRVVYRCRNGEYSSNADCRACRILISGGVSDQWGMQRSLMPLLVTAYIKMQKQFELLKNSKEYMAQLYSREKWLRGKVQVAFDLWEQDILDEEAYKKSVCNCMGKIKEIQQERLKVENLRTVDQDIQKQLYRSQNIINEILSQSMHISNSDYRDLLMKCVDCISVYKDSVHIATSAGDFSIPRVSRDHRQLKLMPRSRLEKFACQGRIYYNILFFYGKKEPYAEKKKLLLEWGNLKILWAGED